MSYIVYQKLANVREKTGICKTVWEGVRVSNFKQGDQR